ncbi:hypothetical protein NEMBOFW57_008618 [Staphylotrichum longicolle]|uniref:Uncharacterized protein n=1 Tax=Staphylotrichum longicolle TaxID=669026 RepID=A0AAD4HU65_9PEZI|nr:hypothetical protein NEMBOFW57_008618 [Staphylotrichum longicolle]
MLQDDDMPVYDAPADEGDGAPRQSYNFAPGYHGVVYRADVPDHRAGGKEKVPHYVRRKDGGLMLFAGLWDCVRYDHTAKEGELEGQGEGEGEGGGGEEETRVYTYTVITTDSNAQLKFLHDRMPVILEPASEGLWKWLDPGRAEWSRELQALLRPFAGELEVSEGQGEGGGLEAEVEVKKDGEDGGKTVKVEELEKGADDGGMGRDEGDQARGGLVKSRAR